MPAVFTRRRLLLAGLACSLPMAATGVRACEFFSANLRIYHPWARAAEQRDGEARLCMTFDNVGRADRLIGVRTPVATRTLLAGPGRSDAVDLFIPADRETRLTEDGVHVRLLGLTQDVPVGRSYPLWLEFEQGGVVNASFEVDFDRPAFAKRFAP